LSRYSRGAVSIVIEEGRLVDAPSCLDRIAAAISLKWARCPCPPLVDVQLVRSLLTGDIPGEADIDIEQAIARLTSAKVTPVAQTPLPPDSRLLGDILDWNLPLFR